MSRKVLIISLLLVFLLASCNVSKGGGVNATNVYDNQNSPIKDRKTFVVYKGFYEFKAGEGEVHALFAVTAGGVFVQNVATGDWNLSRVTLSPDGDFSIFDIKDAVRIGDTTYILGSNPNLFGLIILVRMTDGKAPEKIDLDINTGADTEIVVAQGARFLRSSNPDLDFTYFVAYGILGKPKLFYTDSTEAKALPKGVSDIKKITNKDRMLGFFGEADQEPSQEISYLLKKDDALEGEGYQIWLDKTDTRSSLLDEKLQDQNIAFVNYTEAGKAQIVLDNGRTWTIDSDGSNPILSIVSTFSPINPSFISSIGETQIMGSDYGYWEIKDEKLVAPSSETTDLASYKEKRIGTYGITGVQEIDDVVYLTTVKNGVWKRDPVTKKWSGI